MRNERARLHSDSHDTVASSTDTLLSALCPASSQPNLLSIRLQISTRSQTGIRPRRTPASFVCTLHARAQFIYLVTTSPNNTSPPPSPSHSIHILLVLFVVASRRNEFLPSAHLLHAQRHANHRQRIPTLQQRPHARLWVLRNQSLGRGPRGHCKRRVRSERVVSEL
jgi:hypothetical protein